MCACLAVLPDVRVRSVPTTTNAWPTSSWAAVLSCEPGAQTLARDMAYELIPVIQRRALHARLAEVRQQQLLQPRTCLHAALCLCALHGLHPIFAGMPWCNSIKQSTARRLQQAERKGHVRAIMHRASCHDLFSAESVTSAS